MDSREAEIEWIVKGKMNYFGLCELVMIDHYDSRSFNFGLVLCALDFRTHFHIHYNVLHVCDARQQAYYWCGVHGAFHLKYSIFLLCLNSAQLF